MCSTIMNLLSLANEDSVPGADDFVPVLVFVLIRVSTSDLCICNNCVCVCVKPVLSICSSSFTEANMLHKCYKYQIK